jgi:hypothetical protein
VKGELREPLIIINSLLPQKRESSDVRNFWIPAFAGITFLEGELILRMPFDQKL